MAGALTVDTLKASTGVLATQNGMDGIAKAWASFNGTTSPATIRGSYNVSSITKNGTGDFTVNFTTSMTNANYSFVGTGSQLTAWICGVNNNYAPTTSSVRINTCSSGGVVTDSTYSFFAVFSN